MNKIQRWFITYGPGSVGSVARVLTRSYLKMRKDFNSSHRDALLLMIENRYPQGKAIIGPEVLPKTKEEIVDESQEDLKEIILYILSVENSAIDRIINTGHRLFFDIISVIKEVVDEEMSSSKTGER